MRHRLLASCVCLLLVAPGAAPPTLADEAGRLGLFGHHYSVIAGASMFVPAEAATRSVYGRRSFAPVLSLWSFDTPPGVGPSWDLGAQRLRDAGREAEFIRAGVGPRILFAPARSDFAPYLAIRADAYFIRLDKGDWRTKPGANVEVGSSVLRHAVVSVRYDAVSKVDGVRLSGFTGRVAVKVY